MQSLARPDASNSEQPERREVQHLDFVIAGITKIPYDAVRPLGARLHIESIHIFQAKAAHHEKVIGNLITHF